MKKRVFFKNAFILTATSLLLRTAGMLFRVYMSNKIGAEGMGLYQIIFSVYILATTFASAGISVGVTRLITDCAASQNRGGVRNIIQVTFSASILLGLVSGAALYFGADFIAAHWLSDMRAATSLRILSPALPFIAVSSCLRGYFVARRKVAVSSGAQIFEQVCRMALIFILLDRFTGGLEAACMAIVIGNTASEVLSCLYMYIGYLRDSRKLAYGGSATPGRFKIARKLFGIATPLAASSYLNTVLHTIESLLVPNALTRYTHSRETALSQFGMLKAMAMPVLFFPASFLNSLSTLLIPEISEENARGYKENVRRTVGAAMHISVSSSILIAGLFFVFANDLGMMIYNSREVGQYIMMLAPILPFMYIESIVLGIMHGLNLQLKTLKYSVMDSVIRITLVTFIVPSQGINGFIWIMILSNIFVPVLNMRQLFSVTNIRMRWGKWLVKPLVCMLLSGAAVYYLLCLPMAGARDIVRLVTGVLFASAMYIMLLLITRCVTHEDLRVLKPRKAR